MPESDEMDRRLLEKIGRLPGSPVALIVERLDFGQNRRSHRSVMAFLFSNNYCNIDNSRLAPMKTYTQNRSIRRTSKNGP